MGARRPPRSKGSDGRAQPALAVQLDIVAPLRPLLFYLSRVMGCSMTMLEKHYAHLLGDSEDYLRGLLDSFDQRPLNVEQTDEGRG